MLLLLKVYQCTTAQSHVLPCNLYLLHFFFPHSISPPFSKLAEWLDNLQMHLDIGLPLLSELEQLCRTFWQNHNQQNQDVALNSQQKRQSPDHTQHWENANNHIKPNNLSLSQDQNSAPDSYLVNKQNTHDKHGTRTEQDNSSLSEDCENNSQDTSSAHEHSQPLQVSNAVVDHRNMPRRTSSVQWNRSTDDSSFLWLFNLMMKTRHIYKAVLRHKTLEMDKTGAVIKSVCVRLMFWKCADKQQVQIHTG